MVVYGVAESAFYDNEFNSLRILNVHQKYIIQKAKRKAESANEDALARSPAISEKLN